IAAGLRACELGMTVKFYTVAELVMRLGEAKRAGTLERLLGEIRRTQLLILDEWGSVFTDDQMAAAMIDRLAHHGHLLVFEGESYRMKNALMKAR
ncbi:ATP-binding protein, partial [Cohnella hongkongensis]